MLELINEHPNLADYLKDDPVRPHIPLHWRISKGREVYGLFEDELPRVIKAVICVAYTRGIGLEEKDLNNIEEADTAMFYTVWSYEKGAGREIVLATQKHIQENRPDIFRFATLSPLTTMAERFHLRNGAHFVRKGRKCQNFEYPT